MYAIHTNTVEESKNLSRRSEITESCQILVLSAVLVIMALELIAGSVFAVLYDRVSRAVDRKSEFRYLLTHMKRTLESLTGQARFIREIREFNDELSLPNHDIADLETQMIERTQLVGRMSQFSYVQLLLHG